MKKLCLFVLFHLCISSAFAVTTIKAEVNGMVCAFCAKGIEKKLNALPQRQQSLVDLKSRVVALQLKEGQTLTDQAFVQVITEAGYSVEHVQRVNQSIEAIQAAMKQAAPATTGGPQ